MSETRPSSDVIDARARRVLVVLMRERQRGHRDLPISASTLATLIRLSPRMGHETKRRRIREAIRRAREILREHDAGEALVANGAGYWLTCEREDLRRYLRRRRRAGLTDLAEVGATKRSAAADAAAGQLPLFAHANGVPV